MSYFNEIISVTEKISLAMLGLSPLVKMFKVMDATSQHGQSLDNIISDGILLWTCCFLFSG